MENRQEECNGLPSAFQTMLEPDDLVRKIRVPNQHVLSEADVGVKDGEGEAKRSEVVVVLAANIAQSSLTKKS